KYDVVIDWRCSKHRIKREMAAWIDCQDDQGIPKFEVPKGKKASPRWHLLKQLAAYRLAEIFGMSHSQAKEFVANHRKQVTTGNHKDVLPSYTSPGAWSDAVAAAKEHMNLLFPPTG